MATNRFSVLCADDLPRDRLTALDRAGVHLEFRPGISASELTEVIKNHDGLLVRSRTQVTPAILGSGQLRVVGRAGTGTDNVDVAAATRAGVVVMNVPGGNAVAAAEHTIALLCSLVRHVAPAASALKQGRWERSRYVGVELAGKTLGVVGLGRIGREVAGRARGLGMRVLAFDPLLSPEAAEDLGVELRPLVTLVGEVDVLTVHVPLAEATRHLVNADLLAACRPGIRILNVARGGIIDEDALLRALESGHVAGAALDVFETEPPVNRRLIEHDRVLATPHLGASTEEAQSGVAEAIAQQVARFLTEGHVENAVNVVGVDPDIAAQRGPWAVMGRRLGALGVALLGEAPRHIEISQVGEIAGWPPAVLRPEVLVGALRSYVGDHVNVVNASFLAEEQGIRFSHQRRETHPSFQALLRVVVRGASGAERSLSGTLFGTRNLRVVRAFDLNIDAIPEGPMLWCGHDDRPGLVGHLGTVLADAGINIANMSVGREGVEGRAVAALNLDGIPDAATVGRLKNHPAIRWLTCVSEETLA